MPVIRVRVNGNVLDLTKPILPEHDKKKVNLYKFRTKSRNFTPKQLCQTGPVKIYTPEEIAKFEEGNEEMITQMINYWRSRNGGDR